MDKLHLIHLKNVPIFEQLQLEEALLRADTRNFCVINEGSPKAIVRGISGALESLVHVPQARKDNIPIIRRFSGGGTVIVDEETLFITFILAKEALAIPPYPEPILRWSADLYKQAWNIPGFSLRENDYVIEDKKCGGNAQYIKKDRFVHHTSFLWNYSLENMGYLKLPSKAPEYRQARSHGDFLCRLKEVDPMESLIAKLKVELAKRFLFEAFVVTPCELGCYRKTVSFV